MRLVLLDIYQQLFLMSVITGMFYLMLKVFQKKTNRSMSARWHYYTSVFVYLFLVLPYHKVLSLFLPEYKLSFWSNLPNGSISTILYNNLKFETVLIEGRNPLFFYFSFFPYVLLLGSIVFITVALIKNYHFHKRVIQMCTLITNKETLEILEKCKREKEVKSEILVFQSPFVSTPFLYGLIKPRIVLPSVDLNSEELQFVFSHELIHWKRRDSWLKLLMLLIHSLHWFNPLVYKLRIEIDRFCELSCDESVTLMMNKNERGRYCKLLLRVLWIVADNQSKIYSALSSDSLKHLERRLDMIMRSRYKKSVIHSLLLV
ncbi:M56 family metallopeptidase [Bacillaceae bacterium SIJ1]|uniref:M56 family metallopeptidase n=1 Tax=Litoribacterium kuwaitense TaxID=1398745 RepID=UPI0013EB88B9|nr:M56 family metallopeptidase [Litoribacterium kuwaitense]NGP46742.1 M56 family metallopeptidase [Litoribacterium kuwaitense]